jgi:hypothetical protein
MSKSDRVVVHDGRGNAYSMDKPAYGGGGVTVEFNGPVVCLKSVDSYGNVKDQLCVPIPQTQPAPAAGGTGNGSKGGCGCP